MIDDIFASNENFTFNKLMDGKSIFIKYYLVGEPIYSPINSSYYQSLIPGLKEGISGTVAVGSNVGIIKNIPEYKKEATLEVYKYITSKDFQKRIFESRTALTAVNELMDDKIICETAPCDLIKKLQITGEPSFIKNGSEDYRKRYKKYIYQFLFGENVTVNETLKKINDITKFYYISLDIKDSYIGLICFIFFSVVSVLMILSLIFLFKNNFNAFFMFLSEDYWILTVLGSILILWIPLINYGDVETFKCHLKPLLMSIGYTLTLCPVMHRLITQFPEENKIFSWIIKHKYMFLLINILMDFSINSISFIKPLTSKSILIEDGESFKICKFNGEFSIILVIIIKFILVLFLLSLIFVEWNTPTIIYDVRFIVTALYIDILSTILIYVFHIIQIKNYKSFFIIQTVNTSIISITNYLFLYGIRLFFGFVRKQNIKIHLINNITQEFINNENLIQTNTFNNVTFCSSNNNNEINAPASSRHKQNFISRMIDYHYSSSSLLIEERSVNTNSNATSNF